jgi:site-specific DNA-methyltransferase (adenine-specific)
MSMIIPSRWFTGGKGLDEFRDEMLHDNSLRVIHDYPEASDCFSGVQIKGGVSYFLWDRDNKGDCQVYSHKGNQVFGPMERPLLEPGCDTFIRYNEAVEILHKVLKQGAPSMTYMN